ncbi:tumor necrosis factor receptor superfamily member 17 [Monodelphis domestica]|uniref:tumor necrosis factor receptor superfamily member 17 n=1 Tax=Monodelphis domestica TaxID=13616 RepID=UPI0024E1F9D4|nr:tumor necrosis factor receptor superfamily member 17 [Monodelphis domestica]
MQTTQRCFQNEYLDNLLHACKPCHLRCSNTPPLVCQSYCNASTTSSLKIIDVNLWIYLSVGIISSLTVFLLILMLKKRSPERSKEELKNTGMTFRERDNITFVYIFAETKAELKEIIKVDLDRNENDEAGIFPRNSTTMTYMVEECKYKDCGEGDDISFPFPTMEEGATVFVDTKTNDFCKSSPSSMNDTFMGLWKSVFTT